MVIEKLSPEQQRIDDAIFGMLKDEKVFTCCNCKQKFEVEHDKPCIINGKIIGNALNQNLKLKICLYCACDLLNIS